MNDTVDNESPGMPEKRRATSRWRKSSFSMVGDCVELADCEGGIGVRDSKQPEAGTLLIGRAQLAGLLASIHAGDFDDFLL